MTKTAVPQTFAVAGSESELVIETLGASEAAQRAPHYKHMLGWNRKALRVIVSTKATDGPLNTALQSILVMAAKHWSSAAAASEA